MRSTFWGHKIQSVVLRDGMGAGDGAGDVWKFLRHCNHRGRPPKGVHLLVNVFFTIQSQDRDLGAVLLGNCMDLHRTYRFCFGKVIVIHRLTTNVKHAFWLK